MNPFKRRALTLWLMTAALLWPGPVPADNRLELNVGYVPVLPQAPLVASYVNNRYALKTVRLSLVRYNSFTALEAGVRMGAVHVAALPVPIVLGVAGDGYAVKIIGAVHKGGLRLINRSGGDMGSLKQKLIGVPGLDAAENLHLIAAMDAAGLRYGLDYKTIGVSFDTVIDEYEAENLDALCLPAPFGEIVTSRGEGFDITAQSEALSGNLSTVLIVHEDLLVYYRREIREYLKSLIAACRFIEKDIAEFGGRQTAIMQTDYFGFPEDVFAQALVRRSGGLTFSGFIPDPDEINRLMERAFRIKLLSKSVNLPSLLSLDVMREETMGTAK